MNTLRAIAGISRREIMSIERIRQMNCFVRRTLTTKSEHKFFINDIYFFTPHPQVMSLKEVNKYPNFIVRAARNEAVEAIRKVNRIAHCFVPRSRNDEIANFSSVLVTPHLSGSEITGLLPFLSRTRSSDLPQFFT